MPPFRFCQLGTVVYPNRLSLPYRQVEQLQFLVASSAVNSCFIGIGPELRTCHCAEASRRSASWSGMRRDGRCRGLPIRLKFQKISSYFALN